MSKTYNEYAALLKALGDPTRIKIFDLLSEGEHCACNLLEHFQITQPTLSYHMKMLCDTGLVKSRKDGVWVKYIINPEKVDTLHNLFTGIEKKTHDQAVQV